MRQSWNAVQAIGLVVMVSLAGCGDSSTSPQETGAVAFARMLGSSPGFYAKAADVVVMSDGNRVVGGFFNGNLHITGSPDSLLAGNISHAFFAAFRPDGSLAWKTAIAGGPAPTILQMARDPNDNLLLVGTYNSNINFGGTVLTNGGNSDIFFAKLDKNANPIWVLGASAAGSDAGLDIVAADDGTIYMTGFASTEMTVAGEDVGMLGNQTGFVVKIRDTGVGSTQATAAGIGGSDCSGVAISQDGTVVVCGSYLAGMLFFLGDTLPNDGGSDGFIGRMGSDGTPMGTIHIGGVGSSNPAKVMTLNNDVIVTGSFSGTVDFDVTTAGGAVTSAGGINAFVARYSEAGALRWVKTFGPGDDQNGLSLARIDANHILVCGTFSVSITLGPKTLTPTGVADLFIARMDGDGKVLSASKLGGTGVEDTGSATATGSTAVITGLTSSDEMIFPNGTHLGKFGDINGFIFQQP